jgi:hypothetical protein
MSEIDAEIAVYNAQARDAKTWHDRAAAHRAEAAEWAARLRRREAEERRTDLAERVMVALQEEAA